MKTYKYKNCLDETKELIPVIAKYSNNDNLAIQLFCKEEGYFEPYSTLTVNIHELEDKTEAYVDVNNNPNILNWITANGIAIPTGETAISGYCEYPLYKFNLNKLNLEV